MKTDDGAGARKPSDTERATKRIQHFYDADEVAERGEVGSVPATTPYYIHGYGCLCGNCQGSAPNVHATQPEVGSVGQGEPFTQSLQVGLGQVCSECRGTHGVHLAICSRFRKCAKCGSPLLDGLIPPSQTLCGVCRKAEAQPEAGAVTDKFAMVITCAICEKPLVDGEENSHDCPVSKTLTPTEGTVLHGVLMSEACDHYCCGMKPKVCVAKCIAKFVDEDKVSASVAPSVGELDAAVQKAAKACAKWVFEVGPEQQKYAEDFYGIIRAALERKQSQ